MITKLKLKNFKCFKEAQSFNLKEVNLFTGYNGRGKSTVFQSLLLLAQSIYDSPSKENQLEYLLVNGLFCRLGIFEDLINNISLDPCIHFEIETNNIDKIKTLELSYKETSDRKGIINHMKVDGVDRFQTRGDISGEGMSSESKFEGYPIGVNSIFDKIYFVSADRLGPTLFEEKQDLYDHNPIGNNGEYSLNVLAGQKELQQELANLVVKIMDGGELSLKGDTGESKQTDVLKLYFKDLATKKNIRAINSGFGYSYVLPILLAALTLEGGSLFIENPEAHLHPAAQSSLIKELIKICQRKHIQLFIESHSEHVINAVRLCVLYEDDYKDFTHDKVSVYFFDKDMSVNSLKMHSNGQMDNWPLGFFDQAERDAGEIIRLGLLK